MAMGQMTWTFIADDGARHKIGLFHGDNTGHLLIYCNTRIVVIDFSVTTSRNYSFFIEDELCDIAIEEKDGQFSYGFQVDEVTDTPRNRLRREVNRRDLKQTVVFGLIFLLFILLVTYLVFRFID
jgi:hypothetical protein